MVDRLPEELWTEVSNIIQEAVTKTIPKKKKCKKAKCFSEEALQIAEERKEVKSKGEEKERYTQLSAEFQRTVRRDKKAFSNEQCKEIRKQQNAKDYRDLFKKTGEIRGTFHAKMGTRKDRNSKDLKKQKRLRPGGQNIQANYKKGLNDPGNQDGVVTNLEPDILEPEVKWALGSMPMNKASRGDRILAGAI